MGCSPSQSVAAPVAALTKRARIAYSPLTVAGTAADLNRIPVTLARYCFTRSPARAQSSLMLASPASLRARGRACGPAGRCSGRMRSCKGKTSARSTARPTGRPSLCEESQAARTRCARRLRAKTKNPRRAAPQARPRAAAYAAKPSGPDGPRPVSEGENKKILVEPSGIEPLTSSLRTTRSPN